MIVKFCKHCGSADIQQIHDFGTYQHDQTKKVLVYKCQHCLREFQVLVELRPIEGDEKKK